MPTCFLDRFVVILLDLNGTFMFGQDRFGEGEDFGATYRDLGGARLDPMAVERIVRTTYDRMALDYENPAKFDDFPRVAEVLRSLHPSLPDDELERLEEVVAVHELGHVPDSYAAGLKGLARNHRLGLVANIWCRKERWLRELTRAGVLDLLEFPVFSSDHRSMKPSPRLFDLAWSRFGVGKEQTVFIGDSLVNDIAGAQAFGLASVWVNPGGPPTYNPLSADHVVSDLHDLWNGS
ncbi:MAG TPA: HAD family hydrolase [Pirellulales bacterium]|nr:HAD family hydrolase [Pirellulales bacterium]